MNLVGFDYINEKDKNLTNEFINSKTTKKYILGINALGKSVLKHIKIDGIIDDFTRVQSSRKKDILKIIDIPKQNSIILSVSTGSPVEVAKTLTNMGYTHFNYLSFYRYSKLELKAPPFILDFKEDFLNNKEKYQNTYTLLKDELSKQIFTKVLNFKQTFDLSFMYSFTNDFENQYFCNNIIPKINNIVFVDGGGYVGDTIPNIIKYFSNYKKIITIEPNTLHINIAKRDFLNTRDIEFINCGLGKSVSNTTDENSNQNNCKHDYIALNINTIDNIINEKIDYLKLDIEGAEQDAIIGAKNTIFKYHPILAICIYHKASDWYMIPSLVLNIRDDYDVYIRHYMEGIYETVMYFIPRKFN